MSWLGKLFGGTFGFLTGGPLGAILGAALGHQFDQGMEGIEEDHGKDGFQPGSQHRVQMAFFTATFSVMGHIAKADGKVSLEEIEMAKVVMTNMELSEDLRQTAQKLFNEGKSSSFPLDDAVEQLRVECHRRSTLIRMFIEIQLQVAYADGMLDSSEERLLLHICDRLNFSRLQYQGLKSILEAQQRFGGGYEEFKNKRSVRSVQPSLEDAYGVLGLRASDTDAEVKRAYRRLISQHHPDKLVAKGLPEEMMKLATEKTQKIRKAYEMIQKSRAK